MKKHLILFVFLTGCLSESPDNVIESPEEVIPSFEERVTIEEVEKSEMILQVYSKTGESPEYIAFRTDETDSSQFLITLDTTIVGQFVRENGWTNFNFPFRGGAIYFLQNYRINQNPLRVLVTGEIKESHPLDIIPGLPFLVEKIEVIPSCPVSFSSNSETFPIQNTIWKWRGFINDSDQIYSFPSCENPEATLILTTNEVSESETYFSPDHPEAMFFEYNFGFPFRSASNSIQTYKLEENQINLYGAMRKRPLSFAQLNAGASLFTTSRQTAEKADSLFTLVFEGNLTFELNGNQLILSNSEKQLKALFSND